MDPTPPNNSSHLIDYVTPGNSANKGGSSQAVLVFEWVTLVSEAAASCLLLWAARFPMSQFEPAALGVLIWIAAAVMWILICVIRLSARLRRRTPINVARVALPPLLLLITLVLLHYEVPCRLMFAANRRALTAWAKSTL